MVGVERGGREIIWSGGWIQILGGTDGGVDEQDYEREERREVW